MSAEYLTLLLADGRLPTGAHSQSGGLEPALRAGLPRTEVPGFISGRLRTVTEVEAATAVVARHAWLTAADRSSALDAVDRAWRARTASDALRAAADLQGRGYSRLAAGVWPDAVPAGRTYCRAVVVGAVGAAAGLDAAALARLVGYDDVALVLAAALKLDPFDPAEAVRWCVAAGGEVDQLVERVRALRSAADIPAYSAPQLEAWAQDHAHAERRLYRA